MKRGLIGTLLLALVVVFSHSAVLAAEHAGHGPGPMAQAAAQPGPEQAGGMSMMGGMGCGMMRQMMGGGGHGMMGGGMMGGGMMGGGMMGGGMMGMMGMMGGAALDRPEMQKFLDETRDLRRQLAVNHFEYAEARRNPQAPREELVRILGERKSILLKLFEKMPVVPEAE
ncbi:MAG: hypothetical protein Kow0025_09290 [Thermodesulfovibrionales bacterium]